MAVAYETIRRHECQMQGVFCFCFAAEGLHFVPQGGFVCRGNLVFSGGKLHLAKVCHAIAAPDHEIYLSATFAVGSSFNPGGLLGRHACYSKRGFNLPRMLVEKGECLYVRFDYLNYARKDRFAVTIESRCDIALQDESATILIDGRCHEEFRVRLSTCVLEKGRRIYFAALPQECMPQRENEVLRIQFKVCKPDGSLQRQEIVLEFRSRSIRHCFDLITDIT